MSFSDDTLRAFAEGRLDDITRHEVELAMRLNPDIADRVDMHRARRSNIFNAFSSAQRVQASPRSGKVVQLDSVRPVRAMPPPVAAPARWSWKEWGALAAALVVGVLAGILGTRASGEASALALIDNDGPLRARGVLAEALTKQLANTPGNGQVWVGISFLARDGSYCRSFVTSRTAGLACRDGEEWKIPVMADNADVTSGAYRQASAQMPAAVLGAIDERITGTPLDVAAERAAQKLNWKQSK